MDSSFDCGYWIGNLDTSKDTTLCPHCLECGHTNDHRRRHTGIGCMYCGADTHLTAHHMCRICGRNHIDEVHYCTTCGVHGCLSIYHNDDDPNV